MIANSVIETVAYGLIILGIVMSGGNVYYTLTPKTKSGKGHVFNRTTHVFGLLCGLAGFILLIIATWLI